MADDCYGDEKKHMEGVVDKDPLIGKIKDVMAEVADAPSNSDTTKHHTIDQTDDKTNHDNQTTQMDGELCQLSFEHYL